MRSGPAGLRAISTSIAGELGDVLGHVAHALERRAHAEGTHHDAQVAGDRLLTRQDLDRELIERNGALVDVPVVGDNFFGECDIACAKGAGGFVDCDRDEIGDVGEPDLHVLQ
mgnify:CR=1 FL=1